MSVLIDESVAVDGSYSVKIKVLEIDKQSITSFRLTFEIIGLRDGSSDESESADEIKEDEQIIVNGKDAIDSRSKTLDFSDSNNPPADVVELGTLIQEDDTSFDLSVKFEFVGDGTKFLKPAFDKSKDLLKISIEREKAVNGVYPIQIKI